MMSPWIYCLLMVSINVTNIDLSRNTGNMPIYHPTLNESLYLVKPVFHTLRVFTCFHMVRRSVTTHPPAKDNLVSAISKVVCKAIMAVH